MQSVPAPVAPGPLVLVSAKEAQNLVAGLDVDARRHVARGMLARPRRWGGRGAGELARLGCQVRTVQLRPHGGARPRGLEAVVRVFQSHAERRPDVDLVVLSRAGVRVNNHKLLAENLNLRANIKVRHLQSAAAGPGDFGPLQEFSLHVAAVLEPRFVHADRRVHRVKSHQALAHARVLVRHALLRVLQDGFVKVREEAELLRRARGASRGARGAEDARVERRPRRRPEGQHGRAVGRKARGPPKRQVERVAHALARVEAAPRRRRSRPLLEGALHGPPTRRENA
mmetsp:Transcript_19241/g.64998  ORF Transcript_19241/g.64998 Transcript_19241/m.64998 type:complete len:285 (-) Transcript_19241:7-861(-)